MFLDATFILVMVVYAIFVGLIVVAYTLWCYLLEREGRGE